MLEAITEEEWGDPLDQSNSYFLVLTDFNAIGRDALTNSDKAWVLELMAGKLKDGSHQVLETRRDDYHGRWLAKCESEEGGD